jgi:hypothetical protein
MPPRGKTANFPHPMNTRRFSPFAVLFALTFAASAQSPQPPPANYDESLTGSLPLPEALLLADGQHVQSREDWQKKRRPEILRAFEEHVYGRPPASWGRVQFSVEQSLEDALGGTARRRLIRVSLPEYPAWKGMQILLFVPKKPTGKVPCFVGLNFRANHAVTTETDLPINPQWLLDAKRASGGNKPDFNPESTRGSEHSRWIPEKLIEEGCALATAYYGDLEPDHAEGWKSGLRAALSPAGAQTEWKPHDWGGIGAWAWGLSRILDYLGTVPEIDANRCAVIGHSRLGKTALWAGARDERFSIVISNDSGEGGAALMRRNFGETVAIITSKFPHWFAPRFSFYAQNEKACPVDQHLLIALAAPRPVAIGSASEDRWADPKGEFLSGWNANPVYALFGKKGLPSAEQPPVGESTGDHIGYHLRSGGHDINAQDWSFYLRFCKRHWGL